jgi:ABC-type transport system involved in cytochrome bd biosynthesis fused ATPase/permease subunit
MATISPSTAEIIRQSGAVPGADYLLEVANVRKAFPGVLALDDVSFRLKRGHVHALMGENGAGKSTLMKIIAGIYTPDSGSFKLKGQEIKLNSPLDALKYGIAMIHQELNLMNFMTVAENIWIRREPRTASASCVTARCAGEPRSCSSGSTFRSTRKPKYAIFPSPTGRWSRSPRLCPTIPTFSSWTSRPRR